MKKSLLCLLLLVFNNASLAGEKLVLELDLETDLLSLSHNINNFLFAPTRNYRADGKQNINTMEYPSLKDHLAATGLVRMNGEVVGFATEQEIVYKDAGTDKPSANSMWMFRLNYPGLNGFIAVEQKEDASKVFSLAQEVINRQDKEWEDKQYMFLSTDGKTHIQYASGELAKYQGGVFEEYNALNPADFKQYGRFRAAIRFIIYQAKQD